MGKCRRRNAESLINKHLFVRIGQVILSANHVRDPHLDIVANHRQVIERVAVRTEQNEVLGVVVISFLDAVHGVVKRRSAMHRNLEPDGERFTGGRTSFGLGLGKVTKRIVPHILFALCGASTVLDRVLYVSVGRSLTHRKIAVRLTLGQQTAGGFAVLVGVVGLKYDVLVVAEFEPGKAVEYRPGRFLGRTGEVSVLDPEQKFSPDVACVKVVEECGPGGPDMEIAGRARGKSNAYSHNEIVSRKDAENAK